MLRLIIGLLVAAVLGTLTAGWIIGFSHHTAAATAAAIGPTTGPSDSTVQMVTIDNFVFDPQILTIAPGTKVTWINRDDVPHTATSSQTPPRFKSPALDTDDKFSHVFTEPGIYPYFCAVHPHMTGTIVVK